MDKKEIDIIDIVILINNFIKRRLLLLIISIIIGIIIGLTISFITQKSYKTNFFINSSIISKNLLYQSFSPLKINLKNKNIDFLEEKLNIDKKTIEQLADFSVDTTIDKNSLRINLELYDKKALTPISNGFVYYINNLNFVKGSISVERENLKKFIAEIDSQLNNLKHTQNLLINKLNGNGNGNLQIDNIGNINQTYVNIYQKRLELQKQFNETNQIFLYNDISEDFVNQNSLIKNVILYIVVFLFIGFIIALYLEIRLIIKTRNNLH